MQWLESRNEERNDIKKFFPEVKSVISVAINYFTGTSDKIVSNGSREYNFSNYAWGKDYHIIIKNKLNDLFRSVKEKIDQDIKGLTCVDTSPVIEKQWAQLGGIGLPGKNTLIINDEFGSWIFLGELLLNIELEYDQPFYKDLCGSCTVCIDACPTNALVGYQLDATKCISYLTVEHKGDFSDKDIHKLNGWIYGCDICQQVCPWNIKKQKFTNDVSFNPIPEIRGLNLLDLFNIDDDSFNVIFKNSPVKRIKSDQFKRNIKAISEYGINID